jgi:hypothetical protein
MQSPIMRRIFSVLAKTIDDDCTGLRSLLLKVLSLTLLATFCGCGRIAVGGFEDSPDKKYRVGVGILGSYNHAFADYTRKTVDVSIYAGGGFKTNLLQRSYRVKGSDVGCDATWDGNDNVTVIIYDYGVGVSFHGLKKNEPRKRIIRRVVYRLDSKTGIFNEQESKDKRDN